MRQLHVYDCAPAGWLLWVIGSPVKLAREKDLSQI